MAMWPPCHATPWPQGRRRLRASRYRRRLLRMRHQREKYVSIAFNQEVQPPPTVNTCLPNTPGFIVLLCAERWVAEVAQKERQPSVTSPLSVRGRSRISSPESLRVNKLHEATERLRLRSERTASLADRNGP